MRMTKAQLVEMAWVYAVGALGWDKERGPPSLEAKMVGKMGLRGVSGLVVEKGPSGRRGGGGQVGGGEGSRTRRQ
jgi:hypothetical protein